MVKHAKAYSIRSGCILHTTQSYTSFWVVKKSPVVFPIQQSIDQQRSDDILNLHEFKFENISLTLYVQHKLLQRVASWRNSLLLFSLFLNLLYLIQVVNIFTKLGMD